MVKIWLKFGSVKSWYFTWFEKIMFTLNLVAAILIIWFVIHNLVQENLVENCWDNYKTEVEAIKNCEQ